VRFVKVDKFEICCLTTSSFFCALTISNGKNFADLLQNLYFNHFRWKKCYHQLKDEFESFKLKREFLTAEAPNRRLLSKSAELDEEEIQNLKSQIAEMRNRLSSVQNQFDQNRNLLTEHESKEKELHETLAAQKQTFKEKMEAQVSCLPF
jgi:peptidoglycan hydrolase CwlO-like protein